MSSFLGAMPITIDEGFHRSPYGVTSYFGDDGDGQWDCLASRVDTYSLDGSPLELVGVAVVTVEEIDAHSGGALAEWVYETMSDRIDNLIDKHERRGGDG